MLTALSRRYYQAAELRSALALILRLHFPTNIALCVQAQFSRAAQLITTDVKGYNCAVFCAVEGLETLFEGPRSSSISLSLLIAKMRISSVLPALLVAITAVDAKALLAPFESEVTVGKTYRIEWLADAREVCTRIRDPALKFCIN